MADRYRNFLELRQEETEGEAWVREYVDRDSATLIMAPHGGWIEPFTAELARAIAGSFRSLYTFEGRKEEGNHRLHLTSHRFDEPLALEAASRAERVLAIHGERTSRRAFVMVGGGWEVLRWALSAGLSGAGFALEVPREGLRGIHPCNICNRGAAGAGGQLEISEGLREVLRADPSVLHRFVNAIQQVLDAVEGGRSHGR